MVLRSEGMCMRANMRQIRNHLACAIEHSLHFLFLLVLFFLDFLLITLFLQKLQLRDNTSNDTFLDDIDLGHVEHDEQEVQLGHGRVLHHDEGGDVFLQGGVFEVYGCLPECLNNLLLAI